MAGEPQELFIYAKVAQVFLHTPDRNPDASFYAMMKILSRNCSICKVNYVIANPQPLVGTYPVYTYSYKYVKPYCAKTFEVQPYIDAELDLCGNCEQLVVKKEYAFPQTSARLHSPGCYHTGNFYVIDQKAIITQIRRLFTHTQQESNLNNFFIPNVPEIAQHLAVPYTVQSPLLQISPSVNRHNPSPI